MPLSVECQECGTRYNVPDKLAGKRAKCKKCGATMSIPSPEVEVGFAPEEDPLAALQDLARESGEDAAPDVAPAPAVSPVRKRMAASTIPADWTPESVIVEKESPASRGASAPGSGRWANRNTRPVDPDVLAKLLAFFFIAAMVAVGVYVHTKLSGVAPTRGVVAWWTWVVSILLLCFAVVAPLAMIGPVVAAKLFRQILPDGAYVRTVAVATLPLTLMAVVSLGVVAGVVGNSLIWTVLALVVPATIALTWYLLEMSAVAAVVGWVLGVVPYVIGLFLAFGIAKPITNAVKGDGGASDGRQVAAANAGPFGSFLPSVSSGGGSSRTEQPTRDPGDSGRQGSAQSKGPPSETDRNRGRSADNLRAIHRAVSAHFARTNRTWPVDLAALQRDGSLTAEQLDSPFDPVLASADYTYRPYAPETPAGPEVVVAYDNAEYSNGEGANVLFGSGEVRWLDRAAVEAALQQTESLRVAAVQQYEQRMAVRPSAPSAGPSQSTFVDGAGTNVGPGNTAARGSAQGDVAERIKAGAKGYTRDVQDLAVRRGTEQLIRPITPGSVFALLVRGAQGDTVEVFDGKAGEPVQVVDFPSDAHFRTNPGAYALSPDGKLVARLTSFPKLRAVVYSFEKKTEVQTIDLDEKFGDPTIVGFLSPDRFVVRWHKLGEHGFEIWDAKTGKRGRQVPLFRVDPAPSPGGEAVSPDGRTYAIVNRAPPPSNTARGRPAVEPGLQVLLYDFVGPASQPRRLSVPVLNNQPGVQPAGLAFSPDKTRLALLLLDTQGRAVVVTWNVATGKPLPERTLADRIDPPRMGFGRARTVDWVADSRALLVAGRFLLHGDTCDTLAVLDAGKVHGQAVTNDSTVHLAYGEFGRLEGVAAVPLNEAKLPEKPGLPNRAIAAPAR